MVLLKKIGVILASLAAWLVGADLLGVATCFFGDIFYPRSWTLAAIYALWCVLGILVGSAHYMTVQSYFVPQTSKQFQQSVSGGVLALGVTIAALFGLSELFYHTGWERGVSSSDGYVPDSMSATMTFFAGIVAMMCFLLWSAIDDKYPKKAGQARGRSRPRQEHDHSDSPQP